MIKWDEPIQAMDGREARVIAHLPDAPRDPNDEGFFVPTMVWVATDSNGFGDVFLVNDRGVRCDDTAVRARRLVPEMRAPFIRNAPVKREGWALRRKGINLLSDYRVFETEKAAKEAISSDEIVARMEWEE